MAKGEVLGVMDCPECGQVGAEIKAQKSGLLYRWCGMGCTAQFFARNARQEVAMRAAVAGYGPVTVTEPEPEPEPAPAATKIAALPVTESPGKAPEVKGTGNALLDFVKGVQR